MATGYSTVSVGDRADFWIRFAEALIDGLLVSLIVLVMELILHGEGTRPVKA